MFLTNLKNKIIHSQNTFLILLMGFLTTLPHELAHFTVAFLLGGRPEGIYLIPKKIKSGEYIYWTFGSVRAYMNKFTGFFIGVAPVLWLIAGYLLSGYYFRYFPADFWHIIVFFFIEWVFIVNGIPSREDLRIAFGSYWGWLFCIAVLIAWLMW